MRTLIALMLVAVALGGCAGDDASTKTDPATSTDPDTSAPDAPAGDAGNGTPDATQTLQAFLDTDALNGTAPLTVNFTLSANGTGAWVLTDALGDNNTEIANGTELPATVEHTFEAPGNHSVTLTVNGTATATQVIEVLAGETGPTDLATTLSLAGTFDAGARDDQTQTFTVPEGAYAVSAWVTWSLPVWGEGLVFTDIDTTMQANGREVASAGTGSYEWLRYKSDDGVEAGEYTIVLSPFATGVETPYSIQVMIWMAPVTEETLTGSFSGELAAATESTASKTLELPGPVHAMSAHLQWGTPSGPSCGTANAKSADLDFGAQSNGSEFLASGNFASCEYDFADADDGAVLNVGPSVDFVIAPYVAASTDYVMTVWYV